MRPTVTAASVAVLVAPLTWMAVGCGSEDRSPAASATSRSVALPQGDDPVRLDPAEFSTTIDNPYWPMVPGTRWTYRETGTDDVLDVAVTVTSGTKEIADGITARIVRDTVMLRGAVVEDTLDFYAQDSGGTVWYLGEETAEFEGGTVASREGSFEAGVDGALPGIALPGHPADGDAYRQEYYAGQAEDNGEVLSLQEMADVPAGHYRNVLLTKDTNPLEPGVLEYKLYAPGVGPVLTLDVAGGAGREELLRISRVADAVAAKAATAPLGTPYD